MKEGEYMPIINVTVADKVATADETIYVCDNSDFTINFVFDEEWNQFNTKTARFRHGKQYTDVVFTGNQCPVPVLTDIDLFAVGVFAGNLHTTTPAFICAVKSIISGYGSPVDPVPSVYDQIMDEMSSIKSMQIVKIDGIEIEDNNIPVASEDRYGVVRTKAEYGTRVVSANGIIYIATLRADSAEIVAKESAFKPIVPSNIDYAVKIALAGSTIKTEWTETNKANARKTLGAEKAKGEWVQKGTITEPTQRLTVDLTGCTELIIKAVGVATGDSNMTAAGSNGLVYRIFTSSIKSGYYHIVDSLDGYETIVAKTGGAERSSFSELSYLYMDNVNGGYCCFKGVHIADLTQLYLTNTANVVSCNIEIWAR